MLVLDSDRRTADGLLMMIGRPDALVNSSCASRIKRDRRIKSNPH